MLSFRLLLLNFLRYSHILLSEVALFPLSKHFINLIARNLNFLLLWCTVFICWFQRPLIWFWKPSRSIMDLYSLFIFYVFEFANCHRFKVSIFNIHWLWAQPLENDEFALLYLSLSSESFPEYFGWGFVAWRRWRILSSENIWSGKSLDRRGRLV